MADSDPRENVQSDATTSRKLRIATRESPLALWQAHHVAGLISRHFDAPAIVPMVSRGDVDLRPIDGTRSVGVFTKRIQEALLQDEGDLAVHSMKDLPTEPHPELLLAGSPERETVRDCLVTRDGVMLDDLPKGATIGTGSRRRAAQLLRVRADLNVQPIRGNVQTRLQKLHDGEYDAIVLAAAGIERLEMTALPRVELPLEMMLPAPGQGALAIETRRDDPAAIEAVEQISVPASFACTLAERTMLSQLHGGCLAPIAAHATLNPSRQTLELHGRVLATDGTVCLDAKQTAAIDLQSSEWSSVSKTLGQRVSGDLLGQGAAALIQAGR
ncbi:MAG: hydroxymethylbilane synthase [Planctomycetota bacterium]